MAGFSSRGRRLFRYMLQTRRGHLFIVVASVLLVGGIVKLTYTGKVTPWWNWVEPISGLATLFVAMAVWFGELQQDWENSLPKHLTVSFWHKNAAGSIEKEVMRCENAYLASEGDIRAWGQQLGGQMDTWKVDQGDRFLDLEPNIIQEGPEIVDNEYLLYKVKFILTRLPRGYRQHFKAKYDQDCVVRQGETEVTSDIFFETENTLAVHWQRSEDGSFIKHDAFPGR